MIYPDIIGIRLSSCPLNWGAAFVGDRSCRISGGNDPAVASIGRLISQVVDINRI